MTCPPPRRNSRAFISVYPIKSNVLAPKRFFALRTEVMDADIFLTFVPTLDGLAPSPVGLPGRKATLHLCDCQPHALPSNCVRWLGFIRRREGTPQTLTPQLRHGFW